MGMNSWTAFGVSVTEADLIAVADFFVSSGLRDLGYTWINTDDGWDVGTRAADGKLQVDLAKFPNGIGGLVTKLKAKGMSFGIYTAESSVVCSGRPGTLFHEFLDAQTFADWGVGLVKNDNCGEYSYGNTRFHVFADAVAATGHKMIISTEPFSLVPNPQHASFAHYWRTGNDISASWTVILNRIDLNDKWARYAGPGHFNDPDMLQVGNGDLSIAEQRAHFGLWAITKATLILGSKVSKLSAEQLEIIKNKDVIAVNQDKLGIQARKVAINGSLTPHFMGLAPCESHLNDGSFPDGVPGHNGVTKAGMAFFARPLRTAGQFALVSNDTGRCLGLRPYAQGQEYAPRANVPMLLGCEEGDATQAWSFPNGANRVGAIQSAWAVGAGLNSTVLAVANSTLFGAVHGADPTPLLDAAYGDTVLMLAPYEPEPTCTGRNCQDYAPAQSWYWSPRTGLIRLAAAAGEGYRCYEPGCYRLTSHLPVFAELCLARVDSIGYYGVDPTTAMTGGEDVYAGPLSGGAYVFGLLNRNAVGTPDTEIAARFSMLETAGFGNTTAACVRELFSGKTQAATGGFTWSVAAHDLAIFRVVPGTTC